MYAVPQVDGEPCPAGWSASWEAWANGPVCEVMVDYDPNTGGYPQSYAQTNAVGVQYEDQAAQGAQVSASPRRGQAIRSHAGSWVVTGTQSAFFTGDSAVLNDRAGTITDRLVDAWNADTASSIRLTGYAEDASVRNARISAVKKYLIAQGVPEGKILIKPGSSAGNRVDAAVLHPLGQSTRVTAG